MTSILTQGRLEDIAEWLGPPLAGVQHALAMAFLVVGGTGSL